MADEAQAARSLLDHTEERFALKPDYLIGDTGYGNAQMLGWLVNDKHITPHIPVRDKADGRPGVFARSDFTWDAQRDHYVCPAGHLLKRNRRNFKKPRTHITKANTIIYRASQRECKRCAMKAQCCPVTPLSQGDAQRA